MISMYITILFLISLLVFSICFVSYIRSYKEFILSVRNCNSLLRICERHILENKD